MFPCVGVLREENRNKCLSRFLYGQQEAVPMTPRPMHSGNDTIDVELDQLTYSAYLLTLDMDLALSVVMAAIDMSVEDLASRPDLLHCTIKMSLAQLQLNAPAASDRESLAVGALLYGESSFAMSKRGFSLKEQRSSNPIVLLDTGARIAFVLHHLLGYSVSGAAAQVQISEKEYRTHLRKAYGQLASAQLETDAIGNTLSPIGRA